MTVLVAEDVGSIAASRAETSAAGKAASASTAKQIKQTEKMNPVVGAGKATKTAPQALPGTGKHVERSENHMWAPGFHSSQSKTDAQKLLVALFFFTILFLVAREVLDPAEAKLSFRQIWAVMVAYMILGFLSSTAMSRLATMLGFALTATMLLDPRSTDFIAKVGKAVSTIAEG